MPPPPDSDDATRVRLARLERDQAETFKRLRALDRVEERLRHVETGVQSAGADCKAIRSWVDEQLEQRDASSFEQRKLSSGERVAVVGAGAMILAGLISAAAQIATTL
jgi:hypothetical protein